MSSHLNRYRQEKPVDVIRVDRAPATNLGRSLMHPTPQKGAPPFHRNLKTIAHTDFKPHVEPLRTSFVRSSL